MLQHQMFQEHCLSSFQLSKISHSLSICGSGRITGSSKTRFFRSFIMFCPCQMSLSVSVSSSLSFLTHLSPAALQFFASICFGILNIFFLLSSLLMMLLNRSYSAVFFTSQTALFESFLAFSHSFHSCRFHFIALSTSFFHHHVTWCLRSPLVSPQILSAPLSKSPLIDFHKSSTWYSTFQH